MARAKDGEPEGLAILAETQTGGRGSRGSIWQAPEGNLNLSVLLRPRLRPAEAGIYALLAGVAVADAMTSWLAPGAKLTLKWPNDLLLDGAKFAGILIDAAPSFDHVNWLVIGIGVNLVHAPEIAGRHTTTLAAHGRRLKAPVAAQMVLDRLAFWLATLEAAGIESVRNAWLEKAHPIGTPIEVKSMDSVRKGSFAGLSPNGGLLLARDEIIERIDTGEVLLGLAGSG
jgi:BirA family biotin operon repressor/biotin-[acetyl-CoA-carboxylase] ligase